MKVGNAVRSDLWHELDKAIKTPVCKKGSDSVNDFVWERSRNIWDTLVESVSNTYWNIGQKIKL